MQPPDPEPAGTVLAISRYPVKSLGGEALRQVEVEQRGLVGDRLWAVRDGDGRFGSGKTTHRFRRMPGLLGLTARYGPDLVPVVGFPDGRRLAAGPELDAALGGYVRRPVTVVREAGVSHFDDGPVHLVTVAALAELGRRLGGPVDPRRMRANLLVDTGQRPGFDEADWVGRTVRVGPVAVLRVVAPMTRCVMVNMAQVGLPADRRVLGAVADANDLALGVFAEVLRPGPVQVGDPVLRGAGG